jgi:hypothetical protein
MDVKYPEPPESVDPFDRPLLERATQLLEATVNTTSSGAPAINPRNLTATWSKGLRQNKLVKLVLC